MNLISCESCGIVLNVAVLQEQIERAEEGSYLDDGSVNCDFTGWNNSLDRLEIIIDCPVCKHGIMTGIPV